MKMSVFGNFGLLKYNEYTKTIIRNNQLNNVICGISGQYFWSHQGIKHALNNSVQPIISQIIAWKPNKYPKKYN